MSSPGANSSLRPSWFKGSGSGGGKGFQPPPTATDRGDKARSASVGSAGESHRDSNKFAALLDDDDVMVGNGVETSSNKPPPSSNSRSEAFRSSFNRSASTGAKAAGRSLADLAAKAPESSTAGRRHSSFGEGGRAGTGRFPGNRPGEGGQPGGSIDSYKPDPKVVRYTREKLLSLRPAPRGDDPGPPDVLKPLEGSVILSLTAQDPVCWDTFDAESIWETVRERRSSALGVKPGLEVDARRRNAPNSGRWSRGLALPPPEEAARRKERDADNPNELWDDPTGGATGAAADFSSFGAMPSDGDDNVFDFDKMAEASRKLEEEIHGVKHDDDSSEQNVSKKVDVSRPLASAGTTLVSGSGDDVNVFEDFDAPSEQVANGAEAATSAPPEAPVRGGDEDPSASSRLMKMIGVSRNTEESGGLAEDVTKNPWGADPIKSSSSADVDPIIGAIGGGSISLNPWGGPVANSSGSQSSGGMNLGIGLGAFGADLKNREAQMAAEREKIAQREADMIRRRQEEDAQRRAEAEQNARQQKASMQQQTAQQSQIELVLMERICVILENSWGRSDLPSVLTTLHSEDSRVIPLLGNADSLRALIARSPQRVALRRDPSFGGEMAVLLMTNSQWQQQQQQEQQQARLQQEELRRRQEMEEAATRAQAQNRLVASINLDAPWFYSDPQKNIQGPFRGEEMRQWLEAGYFKGDLPISQVASGPFHPLSVWFPNLHYAFQRDPTNGKDKNQPTDSVPAEAAESQRLRNEAAAEQERRAAEEAQRAAEEAEEIRREAQRKELALEAERKKQLESAQAAAKSDGNENESSNQLKMMLGLSQGAQSVGDQALETTTGSKQSKADKNAKASNKRNAQKPAEEATTPAAAPAAPAWGGAANSKQTRKSMSEIQQEEARAAALLAAKRGSVPQSSGGWANVAAGTTGWSSGAIRSGNTTPNVAAVAGVRPSQARPNQATGAQGVANRKAAPLTQQQRASSTASSTPAEEFGTSMPPALETWCKEKMVQISGSDDLTLVAFCMTLNDASEIRQYLITYLGSTPPVNNFATEFINKRGLGDKQEEWETPGSAKKGRNKKKGGR
ncbi:MAG: hypothetical protein SGILL_004434 [Bacillariaceae sp.]